ncbi:hypothetical protein CCUS01_02064 [Colletotrichum cuscutae]|uniref:Nephrocystin 3-like N-terminal domain-containing protein n=1 Tax=Colletotrichum cuscutae TaxID=1209917 RepID=A0AAI9U2S1_9PEZI|nr:hypothetical protein CCUS01_02064 [Colletotrichum cuscutae]
MLPISLGSRFPLALFPPYHNPQYLFSIALLSRQAFVQKRYRLELTELWMYHVFFRQISGLTDWSYFLARIGANTGSHSAPTLFRGGWRRRPSSSVTGQAIATGDNSFKGPLGLNILFEPSETRVDFIFVHGLQGGSRKTWSLRPEDASTCWPEQWLPYEPGFKHVRVHSFGYDSDWSQIQHSAIRIRDFAESLLANIAHSQLLKKTRDVPIVFVAHSMGGLIIKQVRKRSWQLALDCSNQMDINEDFRHVCKDLALWSFHEAVPTAGFYIVDKESAVMGKFQHLQKMTGWFLWLNGAPGSGKSVVSGHVIEYLQSYNLDCSYFFFKNDAKATVTQMLLSLAYQMTECNFEARQNFLSMIQNGDEVNTQDHTVIWNTLFLGRLFKIQYPQPHFWVIDALDECGKKSLVSLVQKFSKIEPSVPLRIFLTSRPDSPEAPVEQLLNDERIQRLELHTGQEESMKDIAAYIRSRPRLSRLLDDNNSSETIVSSILERSRGIFLWASLMVDRLDSLYSLEDMHKAMDQVPSEMNGFYGKILEGIANSANVDKANYDGWSAHQYQ